MKNRMVLLICQIQQADIWLSRCKLGKVMVVMMLCVACILGRLGYTHLVPMLLLEAILFAVAVILLAASGATLRTKVKIIIRRALLITGMGIPAMTVGKVGLNIIISAILLFSSSILKLSIDEANRVCAQMVKMNK